jgi:hypothetical protein
VDFLRARLVALFLISLAAVYGSILAWRPDRAASPLFLAWPPLALGAAALGGAAIFERLAGLADRHVRARARSVAGLVYGGALFLICLGLLAGQRDAAEGGVALLQGLQPAFLLLAGFGRGYLGTLVNAFVLTAVSVLAGGPGAALAAALHGGLVAFFLAADHAARQLTEHRVELLPETRPLIARGLLQGLIVGAGLAAWFAAFPAEPYVPLQRSGAGNPLPADRLAGLLGNLLFIAVASSVAFYVALRLGSGARAGSAEAEPVAFVPARRRSAASPAATRPAEPPPVSEWALRIVKLYLRTADQLAKWGRRRRPFQTPLEFSRTLAPAGSAVELTELFGRARYGREAMSEADFERASRASREVLDHHRGRS